MTNDGGIKQTGLFQRAWSRMIDGRPPSDPLYLSNRSLSQKIRIGILIAVPILALGALVGLALSDRLPARHRPPPATPTAAQIARAYPDLGKPIQVGAAKDVEVIEVSVEPTDPPVVAGLVRNKSDRAHTQVTLILELMDKRGSQLGAVSTTIEKLEGGGKKTFRFPVSQAGARVVIVREVRYE
jgi:hypothetical protein